MTGECEGQGRLRVRVTCRGRCSDAHRKGQRRGLQRVRIGDPYHDAGAQQHAGNEDEIRDAEKELGQPGQLLSAALGLAGIQALVGLRLDCLESQPSPPQAPVSDDHGLCVNWGHDVC